MGAERLVIVDDLVPHDENGKVVFPLTDKNEYWPTILLKALLRVARENEDLVFSDPLWIFTCLTSYYPHTRSTNSTLKSLKLIRETLDKSEEARQKFDLLKHLQVDGDIPAVQPIPPQVDSYMICATMKRSFLSDSIEDTSGLNPRKVYIINFLTSYRENHLINLLCPYMEWRGTYNYHDTHIWTADFEEEIGFCYQDRRIEPMLSDCWMSINDFQKYFEHVHVMHNVNSFNHQVHLFDHKLPNELWLFSPSKEVCFLRHETKKLTTSQVNLHCRVELYNWKRFQPFRKLHDFTFNVMNSINFLTIPPCNGDEALRIYLENKSENDGLSFFSNSKICIGDADNIKRKKMLINTYETEVETFLNHEKGQWKLWFMKKVKVVESGHFTAELSLHENEINTIKPSFLLINDMDLHTEKDINGKIGPLKLASNSCYSLIGYAKPATSIPAGNFSLRIISDGGVSEVESVSQNSLFNLTLEDDYKINSDYNLFCFEIRCGEHIRMSAQVTISHKIPVVLEIMKYEEDLSKSKDQSPTTTVTSIAKYDFYDRDVIIPLLLLEPTEKSLKRTYMIKGTLDPSFGQQIAKKRNQVIKDSYLNYIKNLDIPRDDTATIDMSSSIPITNTRTRSSKSSARTKTPSKEKTKPAPKKAPVKQVKKPQNKEVSAPSIPSKMSQPEVVGLKESDSKQGEEDYIEELSENLKISLDGIAEAYNPDKPEQHLTYSISLYLSGPNVIVESVHPKKKQLYQLIEEWEEERMEEARKTRKNYFTERAKYEKNSMDQKEFSTLPPIHLKKKCAESDWLVREPNTWLYRQETEMPKVAEHIDKYLLQGNITSLSILKEQDLEQTKKEIEELVEKDKLLFQQEKTIREEWTKIHRDMLLDSDVRMKGMVAKMKENFIEQQKLRQEMKERRAVEAARLAELERQRIAEEEKEAAKKKKELSKSRPGSKASNAKTKK